MTTTVTLAGITRTVPIDSAAVADHRRAGLTARQAVHAEALWTLGAILVQEKIDTDGVEAGEALATSLESEVMSALGF